MKTRFYFNASKDKGNATISADLLFCVSQICPSMLLLDRLTFQMQIANSKICIMVSPSMTRYHQHEARGRIILPRIAFKNKNGRK